MPTSADPCVLVLFGASGDLARRKLIPALYEMHCAGMLPANLCVLGVSRTEMSDDAWRDALEPWARDNAKGFDEAAWRAFAKRIYYFAGDATTPGPYDALHTRICELGEKHNTGGNVLFYLSVAPSLYEKILEQIDAAGLVTEGRRWCSINRDTAPWQRVIVEKPFGHNAASAASLNRALGRVFEEDAIYRIDHYLGKEVVQALLVFRFANTIFEPIWNHRYIDHVQITATERIGVEGRAAYYDTAGAIRDMIQSHLLQILSLVAMEPPSSYTARCIREEKIKVIDAIQAPPLESLHEYAALGQYAGDADEPAYHEQKGVDPSRQTETCAALKLHFDNWRWARTPFYVRSGKRMATKRTEIVIQFKQPAANLFKHIEPFKTGGTRPANRIIIEIAPRQAVSLRFEGKVPGSGIQLETVAMDFDYARRFDAEPVEAYGPLLIDALRGDQTLYKHRLEVEGAWRAVMPFLGESSASLREGIAANYAPGSWGPASADALLARDGRAWHNPEGEGGRQ